MVLKIKLDDDEYKKLDKICRIFGHQDGCETVVRWMIYAWIRGTLKWIPPHGQD